MRLLWLPDQLAKWLEPAGFCVAVEPGWETRGVPFADAPLVALGHHTATVQRKGVPFPTRLILIDGRSDLPGPLCQVGLGTDGTAHVIAAGKANHAGPGAWRNVTHSALTVGTEVEYSGTGLWDPTLLHAFDLVEAALLDGLQRTASWYCGHKEWALPAGRKIDPSNVDLDAQRSRIHALLLRGPGRPVIRRPPVAPKPAPAPAPTVQEDDDMPVIVKDPNGDSQYVTDFITKRHILSPTELGQLTNKAGLKRVEIDAATLAAIPEVHP